MQLLETILGTKNKIKVLRALIKHKNWEFNITELSRDIIINKGILSRIIKDLEDKNIIIVKRKGKIKLFGINKKNEFIQNIIIPLFENEENFLNILLKDLTEKIKYKSIISIILYGSAAKGEIKLTSDIDILIIVSKENEDLKLKLNELKNIFLDKDIILRIDIIKLNELKKLNKLKEPFIKNILKNHKLLYGKELSKLL